MIKWLALLFIVWVAIIFVASANEGILYGWQPLVETSNEAASAIPMGHAAFPLVERESRTAENTQNTRKKARLQTNEFDDDLLKIGLGTGGACPSYPCSFSQSSSPGIISVLTEKPIDLANNHEPFKFQTHDHWLFPSGVSSEQVSSQASSSTARRDILSYFDKTRKTDASASTDHNYIPFATNPTESLSESFNLGSRVQLQSDAPPTQEPLGNSGTHEKDGGRHIKRKMWSSWGNLLSLKTGVTSDENDAQQHMYATPNFPPGFPLEQPNIFSAEKNQIATPKFNPQEIQQVISPLLQLGSNTPSYQNAGASRAPVLASGGRKPWEMSSMAGKNGGHVLLSLKPSEQEENGKSWGADQGTKSSPRSQTQHILRAEQNILLQWPRSTETYLNQSPKPYHNLCESGNKRLSSEDPENIPQVSKIPKPHQPKIITTVGNHASQIDGIKKYGRIKFNTDLFTGECTKMRHIVKLLNSIPTPYQGKFFLTNDQLKVACESLRRRHSGHIPRPSTHEIEIFMGNIKNWYRYWNKHANIDVESLNPGKEGSKHPFVFPIYLLYVEMIISIIPFKQGIQLGEELNYPQEMGNAIESYLKFFTLMKNPPEKGESIIWKKKRNSFKRSSSDASSEPSAIIWNFIDFWMESHYKSFWNNVKEIKGFHVRKDVKTFFNTIFTYGIETLNKRLSDYLPHE